MSRPDRDPLWAVLIAGGSGNNLGVIIGPTIIRAICSMSDHVTQQLPTERASELPFVRLLPVGATFQAILILRSTGLLLRASAHQ